MANGKGINLPSRTVVLLVLSALFPLLVFSTTMGVQELRGQHDGMKRRAVETTEHVSESVRGEVTNVKRMLAVVAASPELDGEPDLGRMREMLARAAALAPNVSKLSLNAPDGQELATAAGGATVPPAVVGRRNETPSDDGDSFRVAASGRDSVGHMVTTPAGVVFPVRVPVERGGKVKFVVSADVSPGSIRDLLIAPRLPRDWRGVVVDNAGRIVARSTDDYDRVGRLAPQRALDARKATADGFYENVSPSTGEPTIVSFHVIPATGWSVHVAIPQSAYQAPFVRSIWLIGVALGLSLGMGALFLTLLAREVKRRREDRDRMEDVERLETLGRLTGGVAHDFNNILTIFMGSADTLKRRREDPKKIDAIADMMVAAAKRGQALTSQLLAYARRSAYAPVAFRFQDRIGDLTMLMEKATRPDIKTSINIPPNAWTLLSDPLALENAIINLAVNARDAMPGGGRLTITARNVSLTRVRDHRTGLRGDFVVVSVQDSGAGIPPEIVDRVFDPFFTTKATGKGTGLGLSQVYGFARQSGGDVRLVSNVGRGTRFDIYLPRSNEEPVAPRADAARDDQVQDSGRLLLVEDNVSVAELAREMLAASGYDVVYATSAEEAISLVKGSGHFDAMLSDIVLEGGMSGLDAAPLVRAVRPQLPIVLMTGYSDALAGGTSSGFPVVSKPFHRAEVVNAIISERARHGRLPRVAAA